MNATYVVPKLHGGMPDIKVGDRVSAATRRGPELATVLLKSGFRLRIRTDTGYEFSIDLKNVRLLRERRVEAQ